MSQPANARPILTPEQQFLNDLWEEHIRDEFQAHEHIHWDQASVLVQLGILNPSGLPVAGVETARKVLDRHLPSNELIGPAEAG
jgi:hypothetical protein